LRFVRLTHLFTAFCVICFSGLAPLHGQDAPAVATTPPPVNGADDAITITADGQNSYIGNIATADNNVVVRSHGDVIFADHIVLDRTTHVITATGNVRIFSAGRFYRGDLVTYNLDTKALTSNTFLGEEYPKFVSAKKVTTPEFNHYHLTNATFTTNNREHPSFHMEASTIEYRPNDVVVLKNVVLFIGQVPVAYFPVFVQSLTDSRPTYEFNVGDSGQFGAFLDNKYNWVANDKIRGSTEFDVREKRGYAGGTDVQYYPSQNSDMLLKTYYAQDNLYSMNNPAVPNAVSRGILTNPYTYDGVPSDNRYRIAYEHHLQFDQSLSSIADINYWTDPWVTRDFFPNEYQQENQPNNFVSLDYYNPEFTVDLLAAPQVNPFFQTTERLPELGADVKQQKIFGSDVEYTSVNSVDSLEMKYANLQYFQNPQNYIYNSFPNNSPQPQTAYTYYHPNASYGYNLTQQNDYSAYRYDTYQEFSYPKQYFNFLSLTPRIGGRLTHYSNDNSQIVSSVSQGGPGTTYPATRFAGDVGLEGDFKISRTWLNVNNPNLGIDGLRHVIEPYFDAQYAPSPTVTPNNIRGFDDRLYSTQLQPINWTDYNSIDSIDKQAVVRWGMWNKLQTKRDGVNYDLLTLQTQFDTDFDRNFSAATPNTSFSNLYDTLTFYPTPQLQIASSSSLALDGASYNQVDNSVQWSPDPSLRLTGGYHYINHSSVFTDSNNISFDAFYRLNEHWQFEAEAQFEATTGRVQQQQYTVYRDLDSWLLACALSDTEINGVNNEAIFFTLTLKAFPQLEIHTPRL
jgi:LPS-assembly protein